MQPDTFFKTLDERATKQAQSRYQTDLSSANTKTIIKAITDAINALIVFQKNNQPNITVSTPDIQKVIKSLEALKQPIISNKPDDKRTITAIKSLQISIEKLPTQFPELSVPEEVTVKNQPDYKADLEQINQSIQTLDLKPIIKIPTKPIDYTPVLDALTSVTTAIEANKPEPEEPIDFTPVIQATASVTAAIEALRFPVPNYVLPFKDSTGKATQVQLDSSGNLPTTGSFTGTVTNDGTFAKETGGNLAEIALDTDKLDVNLSTRLKPADTLTKVTTVDTITNPVTTTESTGLVPKIYDYISANFSGSTADVYTYKAGGVGGSTAATLTVNWTDSTKTILSNVVRT